MSRNTKIVATIGPASQDEQTIHLLIQAGLNVARLNFSHGSHDEHAAVYQRLRDTAKKLNRPLTILQDLQGPKIRTGNLLNGSLTLTPGEELTLTTDNIVGDENRVCVDYPGLPNCVQPGNRILLDDGQLELLVLSIEDKEIETQVILGGSPQTAQGCKSTRGSDGYRRIHP